MDTTTLTTFTRGTDEKASRALQGGDRWGCPSCGSEDFVRQQYMTEYGTQTVHCSWRGEDEFEVDEYGDVDYHDSESGEWADDGELTCDDCGCSYSECEAQEAFDEANEECSYDEDCTGDPCGCQDEDEDRAPTDWPFLADRGVEQADAVGALLMQHAPVHAAFTWEERAGKTVIGVQPNTHRNGGYGRGDGHDVESCATCNGDMSTQYMRVVTLPHKQKRYATSTQEIHPVRQEAPIELHIPICYVCHTG
jgi:hypothetical protein